MKLQKEFKNYLASLCIYTWRSVELTGDVLSSPEAVVDGAEATQHGSRPQPHHGDGVASGKHTETVPTSLLAHTSPFNVFTYDPRVYAH